MIEIIRFNDKNGDLIWMLTNHQCLFVGVFILIGAIGLAWFAISLIKIGV